MKKHFFLILIAFAICTIRPAAAQYPDVPEEVQAETGAMMKEAMRLSDEAWEKALPVIKEEALNGKPYIPWAHRPTDLPQADLRAFPGAEGGGAWSFGGRGGKVYVVTSLEDRGPGTFRWACEQGGARIVVFNVAGIIRLKSPLIIRAPYITIAGQTAPGDGVCVAGESVWINTHDVVIRHMRFRRGETNVGRRDDAIGGNPVGNIMIDHVSASWGLDENMSMYRHMYDPGDGSQEKKFPTVNITIQNSIFAEALDTYNHSFGSTLGGENCTFMRNLWANNAGRNPSIGWNGIFNFINNVVFNWRHRSMDGGDYTASYNIINNYFKPGPVTPRDEPVGHRILNPESGRSNLDHKVFGRAYVEGNIMEGYPEVTKDNWAGGVQVEDENDRDLPDAGKYTKALRWKKPFPMPPVTVMEAKEAFNYVLEKAGATLPVRDPVDERVLKQVKSGKINPPEGLNPDDFYQFEHRRLGPDSYKLGIITDVRQVGGYPEYKGSPRKDSDKDGMPDEWEERYGLDPRDPSDAGGDMNGDGYTNIEKYINGIDPRKKVDWSDSENNFDTLERNGLGV
ncbi:MAG TPA: polysaccharide lyase [Anseongella sp.]|nr:polysaccharide lyase [Anseongella sp.]